MDFVEHDIAAHRAARNYTRQETLKRMLWALLCPLFRYSPRMAFGWRRTLLRIFGAQIGQHVHIYNSVSIVMPWNLSMGDWSSIGENAHVYALGAISIGARTMVSQRVHLCAGTHDCLQADMPLLKSAITVGNGCWLASDVFVGPDVEIGDRAVIGARAVVVAGIPADVIAVGHPAKAIKPREKAMLTEPVTS